MKGVVILIETKVKKPKAEPKVRFRRVDDQNAQKAEVVYAKYDMDLAILKPKKEYHPDFATFSSEGPLSIGRELFSIGLNFSYVVGEVTYEDYRLYHDIYKDFEDELLNLKGDLRIVQINNSHGSSGAPVFYSQGKVVGVIALTLDGFDFTIHFTTLKQFCEQYYETQHPGAGSQKEKNKKRYRGGPKEERKSEFPLISSFHVSVVFWYS
ncbi:hypothetical protein RHMOL_Rhmol05G0228200 [Rhododendron molle]|uniref:Uncharacterized protein n=1 Tax=Rhododendron molle TaxID=49168 RepID=A0ACC0NRZ8_RHOML|nr:hypothetical protein RHMOL_Rhmol05G0228200 [Rhododendron molle]